MFGDSFTPSSENTSVSNVIAEFCNTDFARKIAYLKDCTPLTSTGYRLGEDQPDLCLGLINNIELKSQQVALAKFSHLFEDLFGEVDEGEGENLQFFFAFPFPEVLLRLIDLFYLMTNVEFPLDGFFTGVSIGSPFCYVLLLSVLCYLQVSSLIPRVRACLCDCWPTQRLPCGLDRIQAFFVNEIVPSFQDSNDYLCLQTAFLHMKVSMNTFFSRWDTRPLIPRFVNPFARIFWRCPVNMVDGDIQVGQKVLGRDDGSQIGQQPHVSTC
jgi:hypothetical protein